MKIIGHRGAKGLALENTLESIRSAIRAGVDAVEIDVRLTKDNHLVLSHDKHTKRVSTSKVRLRDFELTELQLLKLHDGKRMPTLKEAMKVIGETPLIIEAKGGEWSRPLAKILHKGYTRNIRVASFNHDELFTFSLLCPKIPVFALERTSPFEVIQMAHERKFTGVDLNFWILNPLTYWLARKLKLEIIVYTVNYVWMARFLKFLYPEISITTNNPHKLGFLSDIQKTKREEARKARQQVRKAKRKKIKKGISNSARKRHERHVRP